MKVLHGNAGSVYLVGAGPGDPELITLKGARCLKMAEAVLYDNLVHPDLLSLAPAGAERICVGKSAKGCAFPQEKINELLVRFAGNGLTVVRLKGGDPCLFGRGGEEALHLLKHRIPFEIVPGVTSALAAPASAGIPVTQREVSSSVAFVTGFQSKSSTTEIRWDKLATATDTLVVLMALGDLRKVVSKLVLHGRSLETPAAVIQAGTWENQRQVFATLRSIAPRVRAAGLQTPALLVVGQVVDIGLVLKGLQCPQQPTGSQGKKRLSLAMVQ